MNFFKILFAVLLIQIFYSCGTPQEETQAKLPEQDTSINYGNNNKPITALSETARNEVIKWSVFEDFENEVKNINGGNIEVLLNSTERLVKHSDSLLKTIPPSLKNQSVVSRLVVAKTMGDMLHQQVRMSRLDSARVEKSIKELTQATNNLLFQIEEKLAKEKIDLAQKEEIENELLKQQKFKDSVFRAELQDKKND